MRSLVVGVDVGGTKTAVMVCTRDGDEVARLKFETPQVPPGEFMTYLAGFVALALHEADSGLEGLAALGIAVPGPVNPSTGTVLVAGNLEGWRDVPLRDLVADRFGVPAYVEHDANAAARGERWKGCAQGLDDFVFLALGTGIGAGIFLDGALHRGARFAAGEVGNFILSRKHLTRPGKRRVQGDLAKLVGGPTIRAQARRAVHKKVSAADVVEQAGDDKRLKEIAVRLADHVAIAVVNIAALLDPPVVVFGGGTSAAGDDLLDLVRARVARELEAPPALVVSLLGEDAQMHGAVLGALETLP
jgi:glucokinase